jgi:hypothetical protein
MPAVTNVNANDLGRWIMEAALKAYGKGTSWGSDPLECNKAIAAELLAKHMLYVPAHHAERSQRC